MTKHGLEIEERFWSKVDWYGRGEDECWPWTAGTFSFGHGSFKFRGHHVGAHRIAYELEIGELPPYDPENPIVVRHKCDNPPCCNPSHLEVGTQGDNNRDTVRRGRHRSIYITHCPKGHEYTIDNTSLNIRGHRQCITCIHRVNYWP